MLWYSIPMEVIYMSQVKVTNKKSGITYVYESESYWDKEKKQPRNKRKLIGKIDPEAVCFPTASAMACSFDRELIQQTGAALGEECQAEGVNVLLGPGNLLVDFQHFHR